MADVDPICRRVRENLSAYLDGELKGGARRLIDEHLASCEECREHLEELKDTWRLLDELEAPIVPRNFAEEVVARAEEEERRGVLARVWGSSRVRRAVAGLAATAAAAVFLFGLYASSRPLSDRPTAAEVECITYLDFLQDVETLDNLDTVLQMRKLGEEMKAPPAVAPVSAPGAAIVSEGVPDA